MTDILTVFDSKCRRKDFLALHKLVFLGSFTHLFLKDGKFTAQTPLPYLLWQLSFSKILTLYFCSILTEVDTHLVLMPTFHVYRPTLYLYL